MSNQKMDDLRDRFLAENPETLDEEMDEKFKEWLDKQPEEDFSEKELT